MGGRIILYVVLTVCICLSASASEATEIICASTTSTDNSGLFRHILPLFERKTGIKVKIVARGTGAAIEMGRRGDADVVFVHAKEQELRAVEEGLFVHRSDVMQNDFIVIGPSDDPAAIRGARTAAEAFRKIAGSFYFVSRGDNSGTHTRELAVWREAGIEPKGQKWYLEAGHGMEKTQRIADEKRAYTLTDRGTWLAAKDKKRFDMVIVHEGDPMLINQYGIMAVNPEKHRHVRHKEAMVFLNWIISKEGQQAIASFRDDSGNQLFHPNAK